MRRSNFIFKQNRTFPLKKKITFKEKVVIVEEELDGIGIDAIANLVDLPKVMFIDEECGNLIVENLTGIMKERRSQKFYKPEDVNSVTNAIDEIEISMIIPVVTFFLGR